MKVWITKYALTQGLFEMDAEIVDSKYASGKSNGYSIFTTDWTRTRTEAEVIANNMKQAKIASLKKQLAKLEKAPIKFREETR